MQYERVSRALAYASCLSTLSLLMTSMAIAAIHVGQGPPLQIASTHAPVAGILVADVRWTGNLVSHTNLDLLAVRLWSARA